MRNFARIVVLALVASLAACTGGDPAPTSPAPPAVSETATRTVDEILDSFETAAAPTIVNPTSLFVATDGTLDPNLELTDLPTPTVFLTPEGALPFAQPGTLIASETEDPDGTPTFVRISLIVNGGPRVNDQPPAPAVFEVFSDGRITRGSAQGTVGQDAIDTLNALIAEMNFFGAQGSYVGSFGADDDVYYYQLTIAATDGRERTINAHEGLMPVELQRIIGRVQIEGARLP
jgi:hypothetical protein